jgi:hypothetical protein
MANNLELNVEAPSETLRGQASGFRRLAGEILDGEFRGRLLELALDYEREAENLEHGNSSSTVDSTMGLRSRVA